MTNYENELRSKWESIKYYSGGSLQLAIKHPLEWHVRYAAPEKKSVVIVGEEPVGNIASSKSIEATCNVRNDGRYAISFTLLSNAQEDVFITMASDIIEFSCVDLSQQALKNVLQRYAAWHRLLERSHSAILSTNAQKGLIAELLFLKERIETGTKPFDAVAGWGGPDGEDQDFSYEDGWHEIKATGISASSVSISSIEQLDCEETGELVIYRIDKCAPSRAGAFTLRKLVHELFDLMNTDFLALNDFVLKLGAVGYIDMLEYDKHSFVFSSKRGYSVNDSFPRIRRSDVPSEITNAEYQISIPGIEGWAK